MSGSRKCLTLRQTIRNLNAGKESCNRSDSRRFQSVTLLRQNHQPRFGTFDELGVNVRSGELSSPPLQFFVQRARERKLLRRGQQQIAHANTGIVDDAALIEFAAPRYEACRQIGTGKESPELASLFQRKT